MYVLVGSGFRMKFEEAWAGRLTAPSNTLAAWLGDVRIENGNGNACGMRPSSLAW